MIALATMLCACADRSNPPRTIIGADANRGLEVIERVGCAACHDTPGVAWPRGLAGPSLQGFADSPMIAGQFPNRPNRLIPFLQDAPSMAPATAMPAMPLTDAEARDVAAYLYTLHD